MIRTAGLVDDGVLEALWRLLPRGRDSAVPASIFAGLLGVSERFIRACVDELIDQGFLVGSRCDSTPGYFRIEDLDDLRVGTSHLISRARSLHVRVARLRRAATAQFVGPTQQLVLDMFDLDSEPVVTPADHQAVQAANQKEAPG